MTSFLASSCFSTRSWVCRSGLPSTLLLYIYQARLWSFAFGINRRNSSNSEFACAQHTIGCSSKYRRSTQTCTHYCSPSIPGHRSSDQESNPIYFMLFLFYILANTDRLSSPLLMPAFALSLPASPRPREGPLRASAGDGDGLVTIAASTYTTSTCCRWAARKHASQAIIARNKSDSVFRLPSSAPLELEDS